MVAAAAALVRDTVSAACDVAPSNGCAQASRRRCQFPARGPVKRQKLWVLERPSLLGSSAAQKAGAGAAHAVEVMAERLLGPGRGWRGAWLARWHALPEEY